MPSYKSHSTHGGIILPEIDKKIEIRQDDFKAFCMGPDALIATNSTIFNLQHKYNTSAFFITLINTIKENKLYDNSEAMSFLYGQLAHFALDIVTHPLIYYMTEGLPKEHLLNPHALLENYIDDYLNSKYQLNVETCYHKMMISDLRTLQIINEVYKKVYNARFLGPEYSGGIILTRLYDTCLRRTRIFDPLAKAVNLGDIHYHNEASPYLNLEQDTWYNPETGEKSTASFDDLFEKACAVALELIHEVNEYIYCDRLLKNRLILDDISYNTGLPCNRGQTNQFVKRY